jgi:mannose-1-phosphate guanylyltransferase
MEIHWNSRTFIFQTSQFLHLHKELENDAIKTDHHNIIEILLKESGIKHHKPKPKFINTC